MRLAEQRTHVLVRRLQLFSLQVRAQLLQLCRAEFGGVSRPRLAILTHEHTASAFTGVGPRRPH